ncbi:hypothetical protein C7I87_23155 [Mesorhizobium sp. SARCC-RB16n]|nr:hypothetical protein C7I87_23155 [Mesorhizobium sp. SARCC-RB16n]
MRTNRARPPLQILCDCRRRSICGLDEACLTGERLRLDRPPATVVQDFLPRAAKPPPFLARQESLVWPPFTAFRPKGAVRSFPILATAIESRWARPE